MWRVFGDNNQPPEEIDDHKHSIDELFRLTLPVNTRAALEKLMSNLPQNAHQQYQRLCQQAADRAGLLICGDVETAIRLSPYLAENPSSTHLTTMPLLPGYGQARAKLGIGAQK